MIYPDTIRRVGIITPAGRLAPELVESGIAVLRKEGIKVDSPAPLPECKVAYLAGTPEDRAEQIENLWLDPEIDLLLCSRGGFGCAQLLVLLNWKKLARRNIPLAGYSDITALHWGMASKRAGLPVVSPMLGKLSSIDEKTRSTICGAFTGTERTASVNLISGEAFSGKILAGNLTVAASLAGGDYVPDSRDKVILLEDINEPVYKIDRCLTQLEQSGFFDQVQGVVFGSFSGSDPRELEELFIRFARRTGKPVASGFPFGHNLPLVSFSFEDTITITGNKAIIKR
ncbi:MAG: LD-carboxypeptidase [Lentisphaerae bacterium]|nr:LD-carboxypeptidase [Lentisphaerota bacterium]